MSERDREQAIEAAAYRKAADSLPETTVKDVITSVWSRGFAEAVVACRRTILAIITASTQSALDEMIADREKRARETALREGASGFRNLYWKIKTNEDAAQAVETLLDAPVSPSPRLYTEAEVTERVREALNPIDRCFEASIKNYEHLNGEAARKCAQEGRRLIAALRAESQSKSGGSK